VTVKRCVFCEVQTAFLNIIQISFGFAGEIPICNQLLYHLPEQSLVLALHCYRPMILRINGYYFNSAN
jgi:hypothetical protein